MLTGLTVVAILQYIHVLNRYVGMPQTNIMYVNYTSTNKIKSLYVKKHYKLNQKTRNRKSM